MNWPSGSVILFSVSSTRGKLDFTSPHSTDVVYSEPMSLSVKKIPQIRIDFLAGITEMKKLFLHLLNNKDIQSNLY